MRPPSRSLKKTMSKMVGERDYLSGVGKDLELGEVVKGGMDSQFGALLYKTLEEIERANYAELVGTSPYRVFRQVQIRAELRVAQYIKSRLESYVVNSDALIENLKEFEDAQ